MTERISRRFLLLVLFGTAACARPKTYKNRPAPKSPEQTQLESSRDIHNRIDAARGTVKDGHR